MLICLRITCRWDRSRQYLCSYSQIIRLHHFLAVVIWTYLQIVSPLYRLRIMLDLLTQQTVVQHQVSSCCKQDLIILIDVKNPDIADAMNLLIKHISRSIDESDGSTVACTYIVSYICTVIDSIACAVFDSYVSTVLDTYV